MISKMSRKLGFIHSAALLLVSGIGCVLAAQGCTISTGGVDDRCTRDDSVDGCTGASLGYSCSGARTPESSDADLSCSTGVIRGNDTLYCCASGSTDSCGADSSVACTDGSTGYSCDGVDTPAELDSTLTCGAGVTGVDGELDYCCASTSSGCIADSTVSGCSSDASGYSCTGSEAPSDTDSSLSCSAGTIDGAETLYCCVALGSGSTCAEDPTVEGCTGSSFGFSCLGSDTPEDADPSLTCSAGTFDNGETLYCCTD